ncbi:MAG: peptidoglycan DD-metalloendopeptidase family protein [Sphingobacteriales bacterium]|nr:peptidoglycan DD-metalloendopeptidase family protein [Sphingobacteriales bacterium]
MKKRLFTLAYLISFFPADDIKAQLFSETIYPQGYFQWPVGAKVALAANFGELRPNHFHMGLDCKTDQKENVPVYAAAEGYIAKVKIEPFGFGRAIYINHPNGLTTLYAHLNRFYPELEKYITEQQYLREKWNVMIDLPPQRFPVSKGQFISASGNTGGSQGPHLHFEIRDTKSDKVLNPMLFGFDIEDDVAPEILRLAVYDRTRSTYEQPPQLLSLKKVNGVYRPVSGDVIALSNRVSFAITAYDRYTGSGNQNGIYQAELYHNGTSIAGFRMDSISYDETRYLNAHIDYKTRANGGPYLQHLSVLPGYRDGIYRTAVGQDGVISLSDENPHQISILVTDANGNVSTLQFQLKRNAAMDSKRKDTGQLLVPSQLNVFEAKTVRFYLPEGSIYDSFHFQFSETAPLQGKAVYQLHRADVPLQQYIKIQIRDFFSTEDTGRMMMKRTWKSKTDFKKAEFNQYWYCAAFREFGQFQLVADSLPPVVTALGGFRNGIKWVGAKKIAFMVTDNTEEIKEFTARLDGKWLCFSNDKGKVFQYQPDEHLTAGEHELFIQVTDLSGNRTEKTYQFTR